MKNEYSFFHGLAAYRGGNKAFDVISKASRIFGVDICASDKAIGPIGVYCTGIVADVYYKDAWSWIENGRRVVDADHVGVNMNHPEGWLKAMRECIAEEGENYRYSEVIMEPESIDAIWVKKDASEKYQKIARVLARMYKVPVIVVTDKSSALEWR